MMRDALQSVLEMTDYFMALAAERRARPRNDLLSALAQAEEQGDRLTGEELVANCILLLVAGHETTTNLIGNGILALLQHPEELARLREHPEMIGTAVEEILRYDSPVQGTSRKAAVDLELGGQQVQAGQFVSLMIGAANRDPAQFPDPDRFDIGRRENRHLSFSHGPHFCLGAPLARLEGQIALSTLVRRLPDLRLATDTIEWRDNFTLRGAKALPMEF
jgi:cytochrome P450